VAADDAERTEEPTPKRREDARRKGDVAQSRDIASVLVLAVAFGGLGFFFADGVARSVAEQARGVWGGTSLQPNSIADFHALILHHLLENARVLVAPLLAIALVGTAAGLIQVGPMFSTEALAFKGSRISLVKGTQRMFSAERLADFFKTLLKLVVVMTAAFLVVHARQDEIVALGARPLAASLEPMRDLVLLFALFSLIGLTLLAVLDLVWVRHRHEKKLKMTRKEVRDEMREREGNPQLKSRMRQIQRDLSRQRMIAEVASADVVVTNPTHYAVALRYAAREMSAPSVLAMGRNHVAGRIRDAARRHGVPVYENPPLARMLYRTAKIGEEVPASLYRAVAEVMAYVYRLDPKRAAGWRRSS